MKSFDLKKSFSKSRTVYTMAAVSLCLAVIAAAVVYSQTMKTVKKSLPEEISTTKQVHVNQTDVTDIRTVQTTTARPTTEKATTTTTEDITAEEQAEDFSTSEQADYSTDDISSSVVSVAAAQSYIRPHDGEIIRAYSPEIPLYCETMNDWRTHCGIDIAINEGDEVLSVGKGTVSRVIVDSAYGYTVEVNYGSFTARYCGMKQGDSVGIGQSLEKGDSIGIVESVPCEAKSAPHLHFEVLVDGDYADPQKTCKW